MEMSVMFTEKMSKKPKITLDIAMIMTVCLLIVGAIWYVSETDKQIRKTVIVTAKVLESNAQVAGRFLKLAYYMKVFIPADGKEKMVLSDEATYLRVEKDRVYSFSYMTKKNIMIIVDGEKQ